MKKISVLMNLVLFLCLVAAIPATALNHLQKGKRLSGEENARLLMEKMKTTDPAVQKVFDKSVAWAVFPKIGKAAVGIGGAGGNGRVYHKGEFIGTTTMTQVSVGLQLGGQVYGEVILFENDTALGKFKNGMFEIGANLSAVVLTSGKAGTATFKDGTIIFVVPERGIMCEASISGQKFTFKTCK